MGAITCKTYKFLSRSLQKRWSAVFHQKPDIKSTQNYNYYRWLYFCFWLHPMRIARYKVRCIYLISNEAACIIPIIIDRQTKTLYGFSVFGRLDYDDIITNTSDPDTIRQFVRTAFGPYSGYRVLYKYVNECSSLYIAFRELCIFEEECVDIILPESYEEYLSSLTPHQRQNIRTAYNRLNKSNIGLHISKYGTNYPVPKRLWDELNIIYQKRHNMPIKRIERWRNAYYHILRKNDDALIFVLSSDDGSPMAYMAGLYNESQRTFYIPRLCINNEFTHYSPGIILLCETIKQIIPMGVKNLDLMRGDEPYKLAMGGTINKNYRLDCMVDDLL